MDTLNPIFSVSGIMAVVFGVQVALLTSPAAAGIPMAGARSGVGSLLSSSVYPGSVCQSFAETLCNYVPPLNPGEPPSDGSGTR